MEFNNQDFKIIVAHPDDEILFFNSIVNLAQKIIICFEGSINNDVSAGRKKLALHYPYKNIEILSLTEANVYDGLSFSQRKISREGISVQEDAVEYIKNFDKLITKLRGVLKKGEVIFTHNPWGEYGHPEHIQVFTAVQSLISELELKVYVNGYVSDKTFGLMTKRYKLLSSESYLMYTDLELGQSIKKLYISNNCWTWNKDYVWPSNEIFYRLCEPNKINVVHIKHSSYPPLSILTDKFTHSKLKHFASKYLSEKLKSFIMKTLKIK